MALIRETLGMAEDETLVPFSAEKGEGKGQLLSLLQAFCEAKQGGENDGESEV